MRVYTKPLALLILLSISQVLRAQDVDPLTGRAIVNISLASVSFQDLSVGVGLSNIGGALRVSDGPGNAGMGWNVSFGGGSISREVRGLPDEYAGTSGDNRKGWIQNLSTSASIQNYTSSADTAMADCSAENADWRFINNLGYANDPEPDVFYFNAPGLSGKFVFSCFGGTPQVIPYQDLQISANITTSSTITITTNTGLVYTFGAPDVVTRQAFQYKYATINKWQSSYYYYARPITFNVNWNLISITSAATGASVVYSYSSGDQQASTQFFSVVQPTYTNKADTLYFLQDIYKPMFLNTVSLKNYSINVNWANAVVNSIVIKEQETGDTREFDFGYLSIHSSSDRNSPQLNKPFLQTIRQQNSCSTFPSYKFYYMGVDTVALTAAVPWRTTWGQDFFGYYNGVDNNANVPQVYFYSGESGARRYRVTRIKSDSASKTLPVSGGCSVATASSSSNIPMTPASTAIGALYRIDYPTGGTTLYSYEPNKYWDASTGEELYGPGIRVSSVVSYTDEKAYGNNTQNYKTYHSLTKTYTYVLGSNTSGTLLYPPVFAFTDGVNVYRTQTNMAPSTTVLYSKTTETISGQGYRIYTYDVPNMYPDNTAGVTFAKVARSKATNGNCSAGNTHNYLKEGVYTFPFAPLQDLDYKRAFLTGISEYTTAG
ncbi:MAG TPA: hypothetical protein VKQ08_05830, partial [Cyclobacteriaceae bacterium]|nr:hypothetical protein [Cyclobacteriaceae bacterium]